MKITVKHVDFGSLRALVRVNVDGMEIRGFKVIDPGNGQEPWVAVPDREIIRNGTKEYYGIVRFDDKETRLAFQEKVLAEWRKGV